MKRVAGLWAVIVLVSGCGPRPQGPAMPARVADAWARASAGEASAGAAYLTLESPGGDRLVAVSVPPTVARFAQIHETARSSPSRFAGELSMRHVEGVDLPPGVRVAFAPGQRHVMLLELVRPLAVGDTFPLVLSFGRARPETIRVPVRDE